jgi:hypothetical protein
MQHKLRRGQYNPPKKMRSRKQRDSRVPVEEEEEEEGGRSNTLEVGRWREVV